MSIQDPRSYSSESFEAVQLMYSGVVGTLLGTVATTAAGNELFTVPTGVKGRILGAVIKVTNGGSAGTAGDAGPGFGIVSSLAGTGAVVVVASAVYGTRADNTRVNLTAVTSGSTNEVSAGDVVSVGYVAGTAVDTSQVFTVQTILWQEIAT